MPRVQNLSTGNEFDVPESHWSLADGGYKVLPDSGSAPAPTPEPTKRAPTKKASTPRARSK